MTITGKQLGALLFSGSSVENRQVFSRLAQKRILLLAILFAALGIGGFATEAWAVSADPASYDFGEISIGQSDVVTITVKTDDISEVAEVSTVNSSNQVDYTILSDGCTGA